MNLSKIRNHLGQLIMEIMLVALCIALAFTAPNFLTVANLLNILQSESMKGLIALGMTMVIIAGEIDLSVGSMVALSGCFLAFLTKSGIPIFAGLPLTLALGASVGALTGRPTFKVSRAQFYLDASVADRTSWHSVTFDQRIRAHALPGLV